MAENSTTSKRGRPAGSTKEPSYRRHKASGQAIVTIRGKDHYLGAFDSSESKLKYHRLITELIRGEPIAASGDSPGDWTVVELAAHYLEWASTHYVKNGEPTSELTNVRRACRCLRECFGEKGSVQPYLPAVAFSPLRLKAARAKLVSDGLSRSNVNRYVGIIIRVFAHGVENELIPSACIRDGVPCAIVDGLKQVKPLQRGRCEAPDYPAVGPVSDEHVEAVLPFLRDPYRSMVRLQRLTGMRPGEASSIKGSEIDRSGPVWIYKPTHFKIEHHEGKSRTIAFGPKAQMILKPFLDVTMPEVFLFRNSRGKQITRTTYGAAIVHACEKAGIPRWAPNMLRHAYATELRKAEGLEVAQTILGHSNAEMTQRYAERDLSVIVAVAAKIG